MQSKSNVQQLANTYEGVAILGAVPGSPASKAGVRYGDVILELNGHRVRTLSEYGDASAAARKSIDLLIVREGRQMRLALDLNERVDSRSALQYAIDSRAFAPSQDRDLSQALD